MSLSVLLTVCAGELEICHYLVTTNKTVPLVDLALTLINSSNVHPQSTQGVLRGATRDVVCSGTSLCGPLLHLLASMVSTLASPQSLEGEHEGGKDAVMRQLVTDVIRCGYNYCNW